MYERRRWVKHWLRSLTIEQRLHDNVLLHRRDPAFVLALRRRERPSIGVELEVPRRHGIRRHFDGYALVSLVPRAVVLVRGALQLHRRLQRRRPAFTPRAPRRVVEPPVLGPPVANALDLEAHSRLPPPAASAFAVPGRRTVARPQLALRVAARARVVVVVRQLDRVVRLRLPLVVAGFSFLSGGVSEDCYCDGCGSRGCANSGGLRGRAVVEAVVVLEAPAAAKRLAPRDVVVVCGGPPQPGVAVLATERTQVQARRVVRQIHGRREPPGDRELEERRQRHGQHQRQQQHREPPRHRCKLVAVETASLALYVSSDGLLSYQKLWSPPRCYLGRMIRATLQLHKSPDPVPDRPPASRLERRRVHAPHGHGARHHEFLT